MASERGCAHLCWRIYVRSTALSIARYSFAKADICDAAAYGEVDLDDSGPAINPRPPMAAIFSISPIMLHEKSAISLALFALAA